VGSDGGLFTDKAAQDKFVEVWEMMARRYSNNTTIVGFDLANEPVEELVAEDCDDWQALAERAGRAIRAVDPKRTLIVEPSNWGGPEAIKNLEPLTLTNVIYSVHMYVPTAFTHQTVFGGTNTHVYPGTIDHQVWNRERLQQVLQPVMDFQKAYRVPIYIGEFSAIRWAPDQSAYRYLRDVIEIFEANGWDWSYHAFREWQGWSVEHDEIREHTGRAVAPTTREKLLRSWFEKNQK
jgi:aryl-phospho-beta-D-glucosidase BglC (GH1 family)